MLAAMGPPFTKAFYYGRMHVFCSEEFTKSKGVDYTEEDALIKLWRDIVEMFIPIRCLSDIISEYRWGRFKPILYRRWNRWGIARAMFVNYQKMWDRCMKCFVEITKDHNICTKCYFESAYSIKL